MRKHLLVLVVVIPLASAMAPIYIRDNTDVVPHNYIVTLKSHITATRANSYYRSLKVTTSEKLENSGHRGITNTFDNVDYKAFHVDCDNDTLDFIRANPAVEAVYQDEYVYGQHALPLRSPLELREDQVAGETWGLGRISHHAAGISQYINEKPPQTYIYCLDTGVRITHKEFGGRAIWGANFINNSPDTDENGHGTHTCATAAGNLVGVDNTTIPIAVKCLDKHSSGSWSGIMAAIDWAVGDAKARKAITRSVINISIGGPAFQPVDDMCSNANASGMTVVVAASNYGVDASTYSPARSPSVITVAAIDRTDTRPSWSNYGKSVALFAPGADISSAWCTSDGAYASLSGTSMAAPHVAGVAAYLMSREGLVGPAAVKQRLLRLATSGLVKNGNGSPNLIAFNGAEVS